MSLIEEVFGPVVIVARYAPENLESVFAYVLSSFPASLTATLHTSDGEEAVETTLSNLATARAGRIVFNGFPTGVAVSWAQTHGGPWPASNSTHSSVGATAIRRFVRPITFQNAPQHILPVELRDNYTSIPRRIDGVLQISC
ncbi:hypothetical protein QV65_30915 [Rhodococcus erythropolis]|nr:hypothetical protein QV65_30915 [Rhodococcus erythropolis]